MVIQDVHYANVDLEIEYKGDLQPLIDAFASNVSVQHHGLLESGNDFVSFSLRFDRFETF